MIMVKASKRKIIDGLSSSLTSCLSHLTRLHIVHIYSLICLIDVCGYIFGLILFSSFIQHVRSGSILMALPTISVKQINNNDKNQKLTRYNYRECIFVIVGVSQTTTHCSILDLLARCNQPRKLGNPHTPPKLFKNKVLYWTDILKKNGNKTVLMCTKTS